MTSGCATAAGRAFPSLDSRNCWISSVVSVPSLSVSASGKRLSIRASCSLEGCCAYALEKGAVASRARITKRRMGCCLFMAYDSLDLIFPTYNRSHPTRADWFFSISVPPCVTSLRPRRSNIWFCFHSVVFGRLNPSIQSTNSTVILNIPSPPFLCPPSNTVHFTFTFPAAFNRSTIFLIPVALPPSLLPAIPQIGSLAPEAFSQSHISKAIFLAKSTTSSLHLWETDRVLMVENTYEHRLPLNKQAILGYKSR